MLNKLKSMFHKTLPPPVVHEPVLNLDPIRTMVRAVGFCKTEGCEKFNQGTFLFSSHHDPIHVCAQCHRRGEVVKEEWSVKEPGNLNFRQVRVEYNYVPSLVAEVGSGGKWSEIAIVTDDSMSLDCNVYHMKSPLIKTEKRALAVAISMLGGLLQDPKYVLEQSPGSRPQENIISFDEPLGGVKAQLWELEEKLRGSRLTKEYAK